ncbi:hypothetical protein GCM10018955_09420 [Planomonospora venezuelensis]
MQLLELRPGLQPQLLNRVPAQPGVGVQGLRAPAGVPQRPHQEQGEPLVQRMLPGEPPQRGDGLPVPARAQVDVGAGLQRQ